MTELAGRAILVVEDLFYLAMDVRATLRRAGAEVVGPFSTAEAALISIAERMPHCAVLDVNLGDGASFEVARTLRKHGISFFFFTGYDATGIPAEFADVPRLEKPVEAPRLLAAVQACMGRD